MSDKYMKCHYCGEIIHYWFADEYIKHNCKDKPSPSFSGSEGETCEHCRFCKYRKWKQAYDEMIYCCHLRAPIVPTDEKSWPRVKPDDFCGEFRWRVEVSDGD